MPPDRDHLPQGYSIRPMTEAEFMPLFRLNRPLIFSDNLGFDLQEALSEEERAAKEGLQKNMTALLTLHLGVFHHDTLVGWSFGQQIDDETFYMINSAIFPDHRKKGLYHALIKRTLSETSLSRFQMITSRHLVTNNAVLIAKLKLGFVITGFEISDRFGLLVKLTFFTNPLRKKILQFRTGEVRPDEETRRLLGL